MKCRSCFEDKNIADFFNDKNRVNGLKTKCKTCTKSVRDRYLVLNKEQVLKTIRDYRNNNRDKILEKRKSHNDRWYQLYGKQYYRNRYRCDINFRIRTSLRARLNKARYNNQKNGSAISDLGCSIQELRIYLESLFLPAMSWENYGEWHIDHIMPLSKFNLQDSNEVKKACHYSNLQPLWAKDNYSKGNKIV